MIKTYICCDIFTPPHFKYIFLEKVNLQYLHEYKYTMHQGYLGSQSDFICEELYYILCFIN
jgi:hypothetical protein